jgi:hypothetical protein
MWRLNKRTDSWPQRNGGRAYNAAPYVGFTLSADFASNTARIATSSTKMQRGDEHQHYDNAIERIELETNGGA